MLSQVVVVPLILCVLERVVAAHLKAEQKVVSWEQLPGALEAVVQHLEKAGGAGQQGAWVLVKLVVEKSVASAAVAASAEVIQPVQP